MTATRWTSTRECRGQQALRSMALVLHGLLRRKTTAPAAAWRCWIGAARAAAACGRN